MDMPIAQTELRILLLEDVPTDAELAESALREAGLSFTAKRVDTRKTFIRALEEFKPDIVLADYNLPAFDGGSALAIVREKHPDVPVVMVTGAVGDEKAIELLKQGARDYILKDRLGRLGSAVRRALSEERGIRARKAAEHALRESEARFRLMADSSLALIWIAGTDKRYIWFNKVWLDFTGHPLEQELGNGWMEGVHPDDLQRCLDVYTSHFDRREIFRMEYRLRRHDGEYRWIYDSGTPRFDENGDFAGYIGSCFDITERKQMEDTIKEIADRNHAIMETANDAVIGMKPDGTIHLWNHKSEELFGYTAAEAIGQGLHQLIVPERYREKAMEGLKQFIRTGAGPVLGKMLELAAWRKDKTEFPIELSISPMNIRGEWHATGIIRDISERKQAQARILKLSRLYATLSQTNTTIVHSVNREDLFSSICKNAVGQGKFVMAWVGLVDETTHRVKPVCHDGAEQGYLASIVISTDDIPEGRGPTGTSIRENRICYINNFTTDERILPWREETIKCGFQSSVGLPLRLNGKVIGALTMYSDEPDFFDTEQLNLMEEMSGDISYALDNFEREAQRRQAEDEREMALIKLRKALEGSIQIAASISEMRDPYTSGHQQRVSQLAAAIARELGFSDIQIEGIRFGSLIHDIGKIGVPAEILSKPSRLAPLEMQLIQTHSKAGYEIIKDIEFPWPVAQMILQHHERLDGLGYPAGLKGDDILPEAKIIAVADTVEAMSSHRPYRPGLGMEAALAEIANASGVRYDPQAVEACIRLIRDKGFTFKQD